MGTLLVLSISGFLGTIFSLLHTSEHNFMRIAFFKGITLFNQTVPPMKDLLRQFSNSPPPCGTLHIQIKAASRRATIYFRQAVPHRCDVTPSTREHSPVFVDFDFALIALL
jgi:hypothetical protein